MCYEPFVKYGNFSSSDSTYGVGTVVEFSCDPGYTLEQGSVVIECVDAQNPQWNETEPACRGESSFARFVDCVALNLFLNCVSTGADSVRRTQGSKASIVCSITAKIREAFLVKY